MAKIDLLFSFYIFDAPLLFYTIESLPSTINISECAIICFSLFQLLSDTPLQHSVLLTTSLFVLQCSLYLMTISLFIRVQVYILAYLANRTIVCSNYNLILNCLEF